MPSEQWRNVVQDRFKNLKKVQFSPCLSGFLTLTTCQNMDQPTINVQAPLPSNTIPEMRNRAGWWAFIAGAPELEWNPPKKPKAVKSKSGKGVRGFTNEEDGQGEFEGEEAEAALPAPHGILSSSDKPPGDNGSPTPREPTPTMLRLIDEVRFLASTQSYLDPWLNVVV